MGINDSSTGGYLSPVNFNGDLEDVLLNRFLHGLVIGLTGMKGSLVFQRWQSEPPNYPDFGTDWAAVGESERDRDTFVNLVHLPDEGLIIVYRNQILSVLVSFYGPNARANCEILSAGFFVSQNREQMTRNGYGYVDQDKSIITADQQGTRWIQRVDLSFRLRRAQAYSYPVLNLVGAQSTVNPSEGNSRQIVVAPPLPMFGWGWDNEFIAGWGTGNWTP
jgi:hypothetical protein